MKVGILSLTSGQNFGGSLQAYALYTVLSQLGHDTKIIDYWPMPKKHEGWLSGWGLKNPNIRNVRRKLAVIRHGKKFSQRYQNFKKNEFCWTNPCHDLDSMSIAISDLDAIVVGSDQVWNQQYHPDPLFQLHGLNDFAGRRISYAACCGNSAHICPEWTPEALNKFDHISVRNQFTAEWVYRCTDGAVNPTVVCDPTLLISDYPSRDLKLPQNYIATYHIGESSIQNEEQTLRSLRHQFGDLPVVCLMPTGVKIQMRPWYDHILWYLDPFDWLEAVRRATVVYTDSFHAVLFSMRNRVPFFATYAEELRAPRLIELRNKFNLGSSVAQADKQPMHVHDFDWENIEYIFEDERIKSINFLINAFK